MINSKTELPTSDQIVQSYDFNHDNDNDNDLYRLLTDKSKHVSLSKTYSEKNFLPEHYTEDEVLLNLELRKIFKEQHPWSVSDPFPQPLKPEFSPREYNSSPNLKPQVERKHRHFSSFSIQNTIVSNILENKTILKWVIIVLNVFIEIFQAALSQESSQGKIKRGIYLKLCIITSLICLMMSIFEIIHEGKSKGAICVRRGYCCAIEGELFGNFAIYFGLISSLIQLIVSVTQKCTRRGNVIKFDYLPLLLSICYLIAALIGSRKGTSRGVVRCKFHGYNDVEGVLIDGYDSWVFECPEC
ncbi:hypothetical protein RND81_09G165200 [Saponaria officinalis]|uniref:Uncharacterized protein n=1 Tax=Saponaria officinalis TaxID=3572 RepID=A0AAW1ILK2_SAPOF